MVGRVAPASAEQSDHWTQALEGINNLQRRPGLDGLRSTRGPGPAAGGWHDAHHEHVR